MRYIAMLRNTRCRYDIAQTGMRLSPRCLAGQKKQILAATGCRIASQLPLPAPRWWRCLEPEHHCGHRALEVSPANLHLPELRLHPMSASRYMHPFWILTPSLRSKPPVDGKLACETLCHVGPFSIYACSCTFSSAH